MAVVSQSEQSPAVSLLGNYTVTPSQNATVLIQRGRYGWFPWQQKNVVFQKSETIIGNMLSSLELANVCHNVLGQILDMQLTNTHAGLSQLDQSGAGLHTVSSASWTSIRAS